MAREGYWRDEARCAGIIDWFYLHEDDAVALCQICTVRQQCQDLSDEVEASRKMFGIRGVWGGETTKQRAARRRNTPKVKLEKSS